MPARPTASVVTDGPARPVAAQRQLASDHACGKAAGKRQTAASDHTASTARPAKPRPKTAMSATRPASARPRSRPGCGPPTSQGRARRATVSSPRRQSASAAPISAELQQRAGGADRMPGGVGIGQPAQDLHRQHRRGRRPQDQRHVDDREREGEHGVERQADLPIEHGQDQLEPGLAPAVAGGAGDRERARAVELALRRDDGEQQEGGFAQGQAQRQRQRRTGR